MSKKLLCVLISLIFIVSAVLAGCSGKKKNNDTSAASSAGARKPMTLSLWIPTDEGTSQEAVKKVQEQMNKVLEVKFQTHIELHAIPDSEYQDIVDSKITGIADVKQKAAEEEEKRREEIVELAIHGKGPENAKTGTDKKSDSSSNENSTDSSGYPAVKDDQLDIFLIRGYDKYKEYIDNKLVEDLGSELGTNSRLLYTYVYPTFLECANQGGTYAIPNNHIIGEYQLLLINKELCEKYDYDLDDLQTLYDCEDFIVEIGNMKLDGVVPLLGEVDAGNIVYFSNDPTGQTWSLIGDRIESDYNFKTSVSSDDFNMRTLENSDVSKNILLMKRLKELGYVGDGVEREGEKFAVGVVKGDYTLFDKYKDDYDIKIYAYPYADESVVFKSMFAVSVHTKDVARSMEIITYLNTDTYFRTLLQYGAENVNWEYDPSNDVILKLNDDYKMNLEDTGNIFITYPDYGVPISYWGDKDQEHTAKKQNLDSATSPYIGFEYITDSNRESFDQLAELSKSIKEEIDNLSYKDAKDRLGRIKRELITNKLMMDLLSEKESEIDDPFVSMYFNFVRTKR